MSVKETKPMIVEIMERGENAVCDTVTPILGCFWLHTFGRIRIFTGSCIIGIVSMFR